MEVDDCPLQGWPADNHWAQLRDSLPPPVHEVRIPPKPNEDEDWGWLL